jgi:hypothetical protein
MRHRRWTVATALCVMVATGCSLFSPSPIPKDEWADECTSQLKGAEFLSTDLRPVSLRDACEEFRQRLLDWECDRRQADIILRELRAGERLGLWEDHSACPVE